MQLSYKRIAVKNIEVIVEIVFGEEWFWVVEESQLDLQWGFWTYKGID
jgi:hypothetical protein